MDIDADALTGAGHDLVRHSGGLADFDTFLHETFHAAGTVAGHPEVQTAAGDAGAHWSAAGGDMHPARTTAQLGELLSFAEIFVRHVERPGEHPTLLGVFGAADGLFTSGTHFANDKPVVLTPESMTTLVERIGVLIAE